MKTEYLIRVPATDYSINGEYAGTMPAHYELITSRSMLSDAIAEGCMDCSTDAVAWCEFEREQYRLEG